MKNKPAYSIDSVDHALRLAVMLQQEGPLRVSEAAERLGVARSTAHRLLAMLVYRDYAEQDADRRYVAGPVLRSAPAQEPVASLRQVALPHLQALVERCGETVNLMIMVGDQVRFAATVECAKVLRVGDREGKMLPAHLASGGLAMLAHQPEEEITRRYGDLGIEAGCAPLDLARLLRNLRRVRRQGFAVNDQQTEHGVTAIGRVVQGADAVPVAAVSIAMPTARYSRTRLAEWVALLTATATRIERDLLVTTS